VQGLVLVLLLQMTSHWLLAQAAAVQPAGPSAAPNSTPHQMQVAGLQQLPAAPSEVHEPGVPQAAGPQLGGVTEMTPDDALASGTTQPTASEVGAKREPVGHMPAQNLGQVPGGMQLVARGL
jgi:hypothetical protein